MKAKEYLQNALTLACEDRMLLPFAENYHLIKYMLESMPFSRDSRNIKYRVLQLGERFQKGKKKILSALNVTEKTLTLREKEVAGLLKERWSVKECPAANYRRRKPQFKFGNYAYPTVQCGR